MLCVQVLQDGSLLADASSQSCAYVLLSQAEFNQSVAPVITPEDVTAAFTWGFGAVVVIGYFGSFAVGIVRSLLSKL